ncbi:aldolase/citrate lyase family protein, partial [Rhizobiaceae sp. 2RAB30]
IDTAAGVEQAVSIASTPGIDLVLIGTGDLGLSYAGRGLGDEAVETGCRHVQEACARASIACGIFTGNLGKALERRDEGYQLVVLASDVDVMRDAFDGATRVFAENSP